MWKQRTIPIWRVYPRRAVRLAFIVQNRILTISPRPDIHPFTAPASSAPSHPNAGAGTSSSPNNPPVVTRVGLGLPCKATKGVQKDTCEIEIQDVLLSNALLPTAAPQPQLLPEPQESPNRACSTSSIRHLDDIPVTTDLTSSGTSAAETSRSSWSDPQEQPQALLLRDGRLQTREVSPAEGDADPTEASTEVEEVWPDRGPTTGGVPLMIIGNNFPSVRFYIRFGDSITCAVSEALGWLGGWTNWILALDSTESRDLAMHPPSGVPSRNSQSNCVSSTVP